jgi:hypothetical protein
MSVSDRRWRLCPDPPTAIETLANPGPRLMLHSRDGRLCRWSSAGRAAGAGFDQVDAERCLGDLHAAGLVAIHERRGCRGDWEPYQWRSTPMGTLRAEALAAAPTRALEELVHRYQRARATPQAATPELTRIDDALTRWQEHAPTFVRLLIVIGETLRAGQLPTGRLLSLSAAGTTKTLRVEAWRPQIEAVFGCPLEAIIRPLGAAALAFGPFQLKIGDYLLDGRASVPWLALTADTLTRLDAFTLLGRVETVITVENQTTFEELIRREPPDDAIVVYTGGFPGRLERRVFNLLVDAGATRFLHWGDLDLGGLRILKHLQALVPVPVQPWRMEPALLDRLPTIPLSADDRHGLERYRADPRAPAPALAAALLSAGRKAEQEGWYVTQRRRT